MGDKESFLLFALIVVVVLLIFLVYKAATKPSGAEFYKVYNSGSGLRFSAENSATNMLSDSGRGNRQSLKGSSQQQREEVLAEKLYSEAFTSDPTGLMDSELRAISGDCAAV